ncbi:hypothetical protein GYMLUDRAFT_49883 [Collybiopsis luxurians FD-317 M1]|uniref:F-box domain-containing protein n=1 Tax=Collybiopsis luxurians FD-317 M1 TaxID=944289 RepID=A0A0D0BDC8_9AGAR|nr:hypothetical protein GYMLUDRAFT_49883 [Collybiopsis luxurians FD-317 M1]
MDAFPQEILSEIAIYTAAQTFLGPPSAILPLLLVNRWTYSCLSIGSNPYVYAKIYESKFDLSPALRRLKVHSFPSPNLAQELRRKCIMLKRIRDRQGASTKGSAREDEWLSEFLYQIYLMMLEDEGKNRRQLATYARMDSWLIEFWFDEYGASGSWRSIQQGKWPAHNESNCLAMWLLWFLFKPDQLSRGSPHTKRALAILKIFSLGAHIYPLVTPSWLNFLPPPSDGGVSQLTPLYHDSNLSLKAPALTPPAVLCFFALLGHLPENTEYSPVIPSLAPPLQPAALKALGSEWEYEWGRTTNLGTKKGSVERELRDVFKPGSIDGNWMGMFMYTDFNSYGSLISSGSHPQFLQNMLIGHQNQIWHLREYHLYSDDTDDKNEAVKPLAPGGAIRMYLPAGALMEETSQGLRITEPGYGKRTLVYKRAVVSGFHDRAEPEANDGADREENGEQGRKRRVIDVIVKGEGQAPWGNFKLLGRVRPRDGFVSLKKDYNVSPNGGDREKWLYRGYIIGNHNQNISGRWRETMSAPERPAVYEGCFTMSKVPG